MKIEFLPAYSPDLNPIELAFSVIKAQLRREGDIARSGWPNSGPDDISVYLTLYKHVFSITCEYAYGFFRHCSYV